MDLYLAEIIKIIAATLLVLFILKAIHFFRKRKAHHGFLSFLYFASLSRLNSKGEHRSFKVVQNTYSIAIVILLIIITVLLTPFISN